jgi:hypothetical protein
MPETSAPGLSLEAASLRLLDLSATIGAIADMLFGVTVLEPAKRGVLIKQLRALTAELRATREVFVGALIDSHATRH